MNHMRSRIFFALPLFFIAACRAEVAPAFKQAVEPRAFSFPADHASHSGFQTEWWYVTGNLRDENGKAFGYQFTVFRRAMAAQTAAERGRASAWAAGDFYLLHLAVSDIDGKKYASFEKLQRGALGLAGATDFAEVAGVKDSTLPRVWMQGTEFVRTDKGWNLKVAGERIGFDLALLESAPPVLHGSKGEEGLSRKGAQPGQASYYYSVPRLKTSGTLKLDGKTFRIADGLSWMDHEFGSNQLSSEQAGWEWISAHLDNGCSAMLYVLRNKDGSIEPRSSGSWIDADGKAAHLELKDFELAPGRKWKSSKTGAEYAVGWTIKIPGRNAELKLDAALDDQEFHSEKGAGLNYYEGAARIEGTVGGTRVRGEGYLEMTGGGLGGRM